MLVDLEARHKAQLPRVQASRPVLSTELTAQGLCEPLIRLITSQLSTKCPTRGLLAQSLMEHQQPVDEIGIQNGQPTYSIVVQQHDFSRSTQLQNDWSATAQAPTQWTLEPPI